MTIYQKAIKVRKVCETQIVCVRCKYKRFGFSYQRRKMEC